MSFLAFCLFLTLYLQASSAQRMGIVDKELYDQKYHIFGKSLVRYRAENRQYQQVLSSYSATPSILEEEGEPQDNKITSSPHMASEEEAMIKEWKIQARRILLEPKSHDAEETVDSKENDDHVVEDDVIVMDYAQPHRKQPIHNKDP